MYIVNISDIPSPTLHMHNTNSPQMQAPLPPFVDCSSWFYFWGFVILCYLDKFYAPYPTMPIFSNGQDFGHFGPFGWLAIIRSLIETNCMKLASLRIPSGNLCLIVYNLQTSHCKFTLFALSASKLFSV